MGHPISAQYRGFAISVHCDQPSPEQASSSSIAFLSCYPGSEDIAESGKLKMRHAITLGAPELSEIDQQALLLAEARSLIDDFHSARAPAVPGHLAAGVKERRRMPRSMA